MDEEKKVIDTVMIIACSCENEGQDKLYGKGKRLHNKCKDGWRCTVCQKERR